MVKLKKTGEISADKLKLIEIVLFDFDGVFTDGTKGASFNERGSTGCNMLRYGLWRINEQKMPLYAIATGQSNENAINFTQREHFDYIFLDATDKNSILKFITKELEIAAESIAMIGDDVNDTPLLKAAGLRFVVNQPGSEYFHEWLKKIEWLII